MAAFDDEDILTTLFRLRPQEAVAPVAAGMPLPEQPPVTLGNEASAQAPFNFMPQINLPGQDPAQVANLVPGDPRAGAAPKVPFGSPYAINEYVPPGTEPQPFAGELAPRDVAEPTIKRPQVDPLTAARNEQGAAAQAVGNATSSLEMAKLDAAGARIDRQATAGEQYAAAGAALDDQFRQSRDQARMEAERETGRWLQKMEAMAAEEPNPTRYWQNQDGFGKSLWLLGMAMSSAALIGEKGAGQKTNPVLSMLQNELDKDVQAQKARMAKQYETEKTRGDIMQRRQGEKMTDLKDDYSMYYQRLEGLKQAAMLRAQAPGPEDTKAAMLMGVQKITELQFGLANEHAKEQFQAREATLSRAHSAYQAKLNRDHELAMKDMEVKARAESERLKAGQDALKDYRGISPTTGIRVTNSAGKPIGLGQDGAFLVEKGENEKAVRDIASSAQTRYDSMKYVARALRKGDDLVLLLKRDPEFQQHLTKLGYATAKEMAPGIVTDKDFSNGLRAKIGADLETFTGRVGVASGIGADMESLADAMDIAIRNMPKHVSNQLRAHLNSSLPGYEGDDVRVDWTPKSLEAPEPAKDTLDTRAARWNIDTGATGTMSPKEFDAREKAGTLPAYAPTAPGKTSTERIVKTAIEDMQASGPDMAREVAQKAIAATITDDRARAELIRDASKAYDKAVQVSYSIVGTGPKTPDQIMADSIAKGIEVSPREAKVMSDASQRADLAIQWYNKQVTQGFLPDLTQVKEANPDPGIAGSYKTR